MCDPLESILSPEQVRRPHPLKKRLKDMGILQCNLAFALGEHPETLSRWLNNKRSMPPSVENAIREMLSKLESNHVR